VGGGRARERPHRALGPQHAGLGLVQDERETARVEAREQRRALLRREPRVRDSLGGERRRALRLPAVVAAGEPGEPALDQQLFAAFGLELAPQRARPPRRCRVARVRPVAAAGQPRLAARRGARIAGLELVDERHLRAGAGEPPGERRPEGPGTDDHHASHRTTLNGDSRDARVAAGRVLLGALCGRALLGALRGGVGAGERPALRSGPDRGGVHLGRVSLATRVQPAPHRRGAP
jgi:hypothetical protein